MQTDAILFCTSADLLATFFFFQAEDGIRDADVTGVQTCALPISVAPACRNCCLTRRTANGDELSTWTWSIQVAATSLRVLLRKSIRITLLLPNGSRLSCGRLARRRKGNGRQSVPRQGPTLRFL